MIRPITTAEFTRLAKRHPYYASRWPYIERACALAADLIRRYQLTTALELGGYKRSIIVGADVMELDPDPELDPGATHYEWNATVTPWPVGQYGLFVALQVFEHLRPHGAAAFREVCRIADHAIISLPIGWEMPDAHDVHHGITDKLALSWFAPSVPTRIEKVGPRSLYVFERLR